MAGLAGGYAFYTIFEPKGSAIEYGTDLNTFLSSIGFGIIWGAIIFNIDRFIVTSTGQGDGTEAITREELMGALPRIIMGIIIAVTISKPLEIRIFKTEIDVALLEAQFDQEKAYKESIIGNNEFDISYQKEKIEKWEKEINEIQDRYIALEKEYVDETQGERGNAEGVGAIARAIEERMKKAESDLEKMKQKNQPLIDAAQLEIGNLEIKQQKSIESSSEIASGLDGLLERIKISHKIAGGWISFFITFLFVAIELTPIFFKLMLIKSSYDFLSDNKKELILAGEGIEVRHNYYADKAGRQSDLIIYHNARRQIGETQKLTEAQEEIRNYIIEKWKEKEKEKIDRDPYQYIKTFENGV